MALNHVNISASDLDRMVAFLEDVAELKVGPRPDFGVPGYWLYCGDQAVIHLDGSKSDSEGISGSVNHVAFDGFKLGPKKAALEAVGHDMRVSGVPGSGVRQIFVNGPDGVCIELQCAE